MPEFQVAASQIRSIMPVSRATPSFSNGTGSWHEKHPSRKELSYKMEF